MGHDRRGARAIDDLHLVLSSTRRNDHIRRALIMVHGTNRNADHYFATAVAAAFLAGAVDDTVVIAPHIIACADKPDVNEVVWSCGGDSWRSGGAAASHPDLSSFDLADQILHKLANKNTFPNMKAIVVAGHSAGGQFVTRYEMANRVHETLGVPVTYVVANPSSYAWPAATRPMPSARARASGCEGRLEVGVPPHQFQLRTVRGGCVPELQRAAASAWRIAASGYTVKMSDDELKKQLISRPTTSRLGLVDTLPLGGFDSIVRRDGEGPTRRARGEAFFKYSQRNARRENRRSSSECSHNDRCVYTTERRVSCDLS